MNTLTRQRPRPHRRGSVYAVVLFTSLILATVGLASLQLMRLQSRTSMSGSDFAEARAYARSAVELGMLTIRNDPFWRTKYGNGNWMADRQIGNGTFTLSAVDPVDNDVKTGENHPVILTGTGMKGEARFQTSVRMEVGPPSGSCLEVALLAGHDTKVSGAVLNSNHPVSANNKFEASGGSLVTADVEAASSIAGGTYTGSQFIRSTARTMPNENQVLNYYLANGTTISYAALPMLKYHNFVDNPNFESNVAYWYADGSCQLLQATAPKDGYGVSLLVRNRANSSAVAAQALSPVNASRLASGRKLELAAALSPSVVGVYKLSLTITSTGSGTQTYFTPDVNIDSNKVNKWTEMAGSFTPSFSGTVTSAIVRVVLPNAGDYYMDAVSLMDKDYPDGVYYMDRVVLSPSSNPYGATNAQGIYIINCAGKEVIVRNCRIVGTLVFIDPNSNSYIQEAMVWEPAIYNYPALLTDKTLNIATSAAAPSESVLGFNMNPPGTPYPYNGGSSNTTLTDGYPARLTGLFYSKDKLKFSSAPTITGVVLAKDDIEIAASSLSLTYSSIYLNDPPPGFTGATVTMQLVPGTWRRTVD